ncbi:cytochrome c [Sulfurivirga sp.]|uniref:c-type cytochrome n=1 Tax=Sulfurivirga sp. TaxID=2614236 RepID=UPI0025DD5B3A|nr:cytochrome c [Sulfurivirga sp.]
MNTKLHTLTLATLLGASTVFAGGSHDGGHGDSHWTAPPEAQKLQNPMHRTKDTLSVGRKLFGQNCASCHGPYGEGNGPAAASLNPKPANLRAMAGQHPDGDFFWKIANGRGSMPAFKGRLTDAQIWQLVTYIQSLPFTAPQKPSPFDLNHGHEMKKGHH